MLIKLGEVSSLVLIALAAWGAIDISVKLFTIAFH